MITLADVRPGDIVFGPIGGFVPGIFPVAAGQFLLADRKARLTWRRWRKIRHVLVVTKAGRFSSMSGLNYFVDEQVAPLAVQAMPSGAEEIELSAARHWTSEYVYVRPNYQRWANPASMVNLAYKEAEMAFDVAHAAQRYVGTPYGFLTYAALLAEHVLPGRQEWLSKYISSRKEMICSQLADQALADAGFHVFDDGRLPQDVVPAELFRALIDRPGTQYVVPLFHDTWMLGEANPWNPV